MELKLKSGKKIKIKDVSVDEKDMLLDSVSYEYDENGGVKNMSLIHSTTTKWIRTAVDGDTSDKFLKTLSIEDRTEIFIALQEHLLVGEQKASD